MNEQDNFGGHHNQSVDPFMPEFGALPEMATPQYLGDSAAAKPEGAVWDAAEAERQRQLKYKATSTAGSGQKATASGGNANATISAVADAIKNLVSPPGAQSFEASNSALVAAPVVSPVQGRPWWQTALMIGVPVLLVGGVAYYVWTKED